MQPATALPPIKADQPNGGVSEKVIVKTLTDDDAAYGTLAERHNALVNHIKKYCQ